MLLIQPSERADARMLIYNADGSRPEACGNGLRCVAWHLARERGGQRFVIETDAGLRSAEVLHRAGELAHVRASMGVATARPLGVYSVGAFSLEAPSLEQGGALSATRVDLGNPHCILELPDERAADVSGLGRSLQDHPEFPQGVNVGFLATRGGEARLRTFERGVGETRACGTNACAAAFVLSRRDGQPVHEIQMPGGVLRVHCPPVGEVELEGPTRFLGALTLELGSGATWAS